MNPQFPEFFVRLDTFSSAVWYRTKAGRYRLEGTQCGACGEKFFPGRVGLLCPTCHKREMQPYECAHSGEIVALALDDIGFPAHGYGDAMPRIMIMVRLDDGIHVMSELMDTASPGDAQVGMRVKMVLRKHRREDTGAWVYGPRFVLA